MSKSRATSCAMARVKHAVTQKSLPMRRRVFRLAGLIFTTVMQRMPHPLPRLPLGEGARRAGRAGRQRPWCQNRVTHTDTQEKDRSELCTSWLPRAPADTHIGGPKVCTPNKATFSYTAAHWLSLAADPTVSLFPCLSLRRNPCCRHSPSMRQAPCLGESATMSMAMIAILTW